jgi:hypothetical protein
LHKIKVKNKPKITLFKTINKNIREYTKNCKIHPNTQTMSNKNIVLDQKVKLRKRKLPSGNVALFLDYVQNDTRMRESLGLTLYPGTTASIKEKNQRTLLKAEAFRIEKEKEILQLVQKKENLGAKTLFLQYYRDMVEWKSRLRLTPEGELR